MISGPMISLRNSKGYVLVSTSIPGNWNLWNEADTFGTQDRAIRLFSACNDTAATLWAEACLAVKQSGLQDVHLDALMRGPVRAVKLLELDQFHYLLVLQDNVNGLHRYVLRENHLPVAVPEYDSDNETAAEISEAIRTGQLELVQVR